MAAKRITKKQIREVAKAICRAATATCIADEPPFRHPCTHGNCRVFAIAKDALKKACKA